MSDRRSAPVPQAIRNQSAKTQDEFTRLKNSRVQPSGTTATDQPLTVYHSFFYELLSWENPRATALSFASVICFIFVCRYLPILSIALRFTYYTLGVTALVEVLGKTVLSQGLASSFRPAKYFTIPRESLEATLDDLEHLINFFVIESQRIVFAENVYATVTAFFASFIGYWLVKIVPLWGICLIAVTCVYMIPLIYVSNRELIDKQIANATKLMNAQANQVREIAGQHTTKATEALQKYTNDYKAKAQEAIQNVRNRRSSSTTDSPKTPKTPPAKK